MEKMRPVRLGLNKMEEADIQYKQVAPTELQTYCFCEILLQTDCSYGALFILAPEERYVCRKIIFLITN
ncbi:MAG: hypothetical protein AB1414_05060 [bacterium]